MAYKFDYGEFSCVYGLVRQERKTMSLTVYPDKRILVKCPPAVSQDRVHHFLKRKYSWLNKQLRFFGRTRRPVGKKEYISGESFLYLGRQYKLMVKQVAESKVLLTKGKIWVHIGDHHHNGKGQKLLEDWFKERAEIVLTKRFEEVCQTFQQAKKPRLSLRPMKTRWGSCSKKGTITLNLKLIQAPFHCIDYVIMHELCHLVVHDHSPKYYKLLTRMMPDWQGRKKRLELIHV